MVTFCVSLEFHSDMLHKNGILVTSAEMDCNSDVEMKAIPIHCPSYPFYFIFLKQELK